MSNENGPADRVAEPKTWEEAAEATSMLLVLPEIRYDVKATSIYVLLDSVERHLDALRVGNVSPAAFERWRWIAELGVAGYAQLRGDVKIPETIVHVYNTIVSKQHDYGHDNINWGGRQGLVIRTHDKVARIRNLMSRGVEDTKNEPLADSWLDLTGYGLIGMMFEDGSFNLKLAGDQQCPTKTPKSEENGSAPTTGATKNASSRNNPSITSSTKKKSSATDEITSFDACTDSTGTPSRPSEIHKIGSALCVAISQAQAAGAIPTLPSITVTVRDASEDSFVLAATLHWDASAMTWTVCNESSNTCDEDGTFNLPLKADVPPPAAATVTELLKENRDRAERDIVRAFGPVNLPDDGTSLPVMDAITPATALQWTPGPEVLAGLSQMQQSYDELLAPEVDEKPDGYEWLRDTVNNDMHQEFAEYEYVIRSNSEHVNAGLVVQTFTETPTKAFVGGWNTILGDNLNDPHGMWLDRGQIVELRDALEDAFHALNR